jgi:hypothetical protein
MLAVSRSGTLVKVPRRMRSCVMRAKKRSIRLSHKAGRRQSYPLRFIVDAIFYLLHFLDVLEQK